MIVFYSEDINGEKGMLDEEDSRHCYKVLRKKEGDNIIVLDGKGGKHLCHIVNVLKNKVAFEITKSETQTLQPHLPTIAISLLKNVRRLEWFLEKVTEIGVGHIQPYISERTVKTNFRADRAKSIIISAMKQSLNTYCPKLTEVNKYADIIDAVEIEQKFICNYHPENPQMIDLLEPDKPSYIFIGPEGDFTENELEMAKNFGFKCVNISHNRLRSETAGIVTSEIVALKNRTS